MIQEAKYRAEQTRPTPWSLNLARGGLAANTWAGGTEQHDSVLEVLIAHEDLPAGLRAKQVLDRLGAALEIKLRFVVKLWTFRVLRDPVLHKYAVNDAGGAQILILSLQGGSELPPAVCALLDGWLAGPQNQPRALVVSFDESARESAVAHAVLDNLRTRAAAGGVDLFPCFGAPPPVSWIGSSWDSARPGRSAVSLPGPFSGRVISKTQPDASHQEPA